MSRLTDRPALLRNRARAAATGPELFLHERLRDDIEDRLAMVNRAFTAPAVVTGWPTIWGGWNGAKVITDDALLSLEENAHDLVIHALSLHWADDPVGQLVQCRRALKPDGLLIAALFGGETLHELRAALATAESQITGGLAPRVLPMGEIRDLGNLLNRAGLALPVADSDEVTVRYDSALHLMRDLRQMGEANAMEARLRRPTTRGLMLEAARLYADIHGEDGRIPATFEIVTLTGWAPAPDQPQPLKPGSASHRLDDILRDLRNET